eukprot:9167385-Prorocentrum_lima.AAC.1
MCIRDRDTPVSGDACVRKLPESLGRASRQHPPNVVCGRRRKQYSTHYDWGRTGGEAPTTIG